LRARSPFIGTPEDQNFPTDDHVHRESLGPDSLIFDRFRPAPPVFGLPCEKNFYRTSKCAAGVPRAKNRCATMAIVRAFAWFLIAREIQLSLISQTFLHHCDFARIAVARLQERARTSRAAAFVPVPQGSALARCTHFVKPKTVFFVAL
jgi:hypothetical protein